MGGSSATIKPRVMLASTRINPNRPGDRRSVSRGMTTEAQDSVNVLDPTKSADHASQMMAAKVDLQPKSRIRKHIDDTVARTARRQKWVIFPMRRRLPPLMMARFAGTQP
jgi:hypothetical protein